MALSRADWTESALRALELNGLAGVAVEPLARSLGTTKGSFYWHFADRGDLIAATLQLWEQRETTEVMSRIEAIPDPRERLTALGRAAYTGAARGDAHTAVLVGAANPHVAPVLERVTRTRLAFLERLYSDLGATAAQAASHARLAYALFLGIGELRRAAPDDDDLAGQALEDYLELAVHVMVPPGWGAPATPTHAGDSALL